MRPRSIIRFEQLYLASILVSLPSTLLSFDQTRAELAGDPGASQLGLGGGFLVATIVVSLALTLLLWFLIARRASVVAKWILVALTALGLFMMVGIVANPAPFMSLPGALTLLGTALGVVAVAFLFRRDARAWLANKGRDPVEPGVFE